MKYVINGSAVVDNGDVATIQNLNASGTSNSSAAPFVINKNHAIAVVKWIDASNYCVRIEQQDVMGAVVEVFADGGDVTVSVDRGLILGATPFFGGDLTKVVPAGEGRRFVALPSNEWAIVG